MKNTLTEYMTTHKHPAGPEDVKAVHAGTAHVRCVMAVLTSQTCGEPCWHAREEICRCSCGGKNHGCLLIPGADKPERTSKINGEAYKLAGVGFRRDLIGEACRINQGAGFRAVDKPYRDQNGNWHQYRYTWSETDAGAPARLKIASKDQLARWDELKGWKDQWRMGVCLLWVRLEMPARPSEPVIDRETGEIAENQNPI